MKSPDEIKKGLECCSSFDSDMCLQCPYDDGHIACCLDKNQDALAYINQLKDRNEKLENALQNLANSSSNARDAANKVIEHLESRLAQVERERDAAVRAITDAQHYIKNLGAVQYGLQQLEKWDYYIKYQDVCAENTKEDADENTEKV